MQQDIELKAEDFDGRTGHATTVARIVVTKADGTKAVAFVTVAFNDDEHPKFGLTVLKQKREVVRSAVASWLSK